MTEVKKKPPTKKLYKVELDLNGTVYTGQGATPMDALESIDLDYTQVKTKGTFTLSYDGKSSERFFYLTPMRRIFANKHRMGAVARDLEYLLA